MSETQHEQEQPEAASIANEVSPSGQHDRVAMLSLKADGTPDQTSPEIIGDKAGAIAAAKVQFSQQAVSAVDQELRGDSSTDPAPDPETLAAAHEVAVESAEAHAEAVVDQLHQG